MDIAAASILLSQTKLQQSANLLVMKKVMDTSEQNSSIINQMLSQINQPISPPHVGNNLDVYV